jgi:hypothetical protein
MEIFQYTVGTGTVHPVAIQVNAYTNARLFVGLICADEEDKGLPFCEVTKNVANDLPPYCAYIKSYAENEGMLDFLTRNGLGSLREEAVSGEFVTLPAFQFNAERLRELSPDGCAAYEHAVKKKAARQRRALKLGGKRHV